MSAVTTDYTCQVCGAPATALQSLTVDPALGVGTPDKPIPASVTEAYCEAHVPPEWELDKPRIFTPAE